MDLENRNTALQEELSLSPAKRAASQTDWVPRAPAAHVLTGHRAPVTRVAFHPQYSVVASASEDATVKIWDWETGEFERTLKGHTKAIMDVEFDHKGHLLGKFLSRLCVVQALIPTPIISYVLLGLVHKNMGFSKRMEKYEDISWT